MIINKLKALLALRGLHLASWAKVLDITPQALNSKKAKNQYRIQDLIKLAEITNTTLAFIDNSSGKVLVQFDPSDIQENSVAIPTTKEL